MSLAKVILSGTVVSDPEKRFTPNQNVGVTNFNLSVPNPSKGQAAGGEESFVVRVVCWRALADATAEQVRKGDYVVIEGKLMTSSYQTPEGVAKKGFEIDAASIDKLSAAPQPLVVATAGASAGGGRSSGGYSSAPANSGGGYASQPAAPAQQPAGGYSDFSSEDLLTEDDIPF